MSTDLAGRLRSLAQDHHAGKLERAEYRRLRAALLDSLALPGLDEAAVTQPRAVRRPADMPQPGSASAAPRPPAKSAPNYKPVIALVCVLIVAAVAVWAIRRPQPSEEVALEAATVADPVGDLVGAFVERGDWSDASVAALNAALLELERRHVAAAATEHWFQRFVDDLRRRVKEQQALAHRPVDAHSSPLAALAVTVGLDLNKPDAAVRILSVDLPPAPETESAAPPPDVARGDIEFSETETAPADARDEEDSRKPVMTAEEGGRSEPRRESAVAAQPVAGTAREDACRIELVRSRRPLCHDVLASGEDGPLLALIPAGSVQADGAGTAERSVRRVTVDQPFAISVHEVSQGEFRVYCEATGSCPAQPWTGEDYPVVNVSWRDAQAYIEWLSTATGHRYRLPSEAQWEYAARAGQSGPVPGGESLSPTDAHFSMLAQQKAPARRTRKFNQNAFRLLHTLGNVREWVQDAWSERPAAMSGHSMSGRGAAGAAIGAMRVVRGGSYADSAAQVSFSTREGLAEDTRDSLTGFRVIREVP